ncbi:MAG TPA: hypothetical protein VJ508_11890, partial [Saprospiraceae bacterium]|nr:hypothetical protein [Saprospiraceae bacterium]
AAHFDASYFLNERNEYLINIYSLDFLALNNAPIVYSDVRKPVIPNHSTSLKPASFSNLI